MLPQPPSGCLAEVVDVGTWVLWTPRRLIPSVFGPHVLRANQVAFALVVVVAVALVKRTRAIDLAVLGGAVEAFVAALGFSRLPAEVVGVGARIARTSGQGVLGPHVVLANQVAFALVVVVAVALVDRTRAIELAVLAGAVVQAAVAVGGARSGTLGRSFFGRKPRREVTTARQRKFRRKLRGEGRGVLCARK